MCCVLPDRYWTAAAPTPSGQSNVFYAYDDWSLLLILMSGFPDIRMRHEDMTVSHPPSITDSLLPNIQRFPIFEILNNQLIVLKYWIILRITDWSSIKMWTKRKWNTNKIYRCCLVTKEKSKCPIEQFVWKCICFASIPQLYGVMSCQSCTFTTPTCRSRWLVTYKGSALECFSCLATAEPTLFVKSFFTF